MNSTSTILSLYSSLTGLTIDDLIDAEMAEDKEQARTNNWCKMFDHLNTQRKNDVCPIQ